METIVIPACEGRAFRVKEGQVFRIVNSKGEQTCDFFAFRADYLAEWLSPNHSYSFMGHLRPRPGDVFASRFYRPMLKFLADTSNGWHDMLYAACGLMGYERWRSQEVWHANCEDNLRNAMYRLGYSIDVILNRLISLCRSMLVQMATFCPSPTRLKQDPMWSSNLSWI